MADPKRPAPQACIPEMMRLEKRVPAENQHRFYNLDLAPDLFGGWTLVREYGRIGNPGRLVIDWFETKEESREALQRLARQKQQRGYNLANLR